MIKHDLIEQVGGIERARGIVEGAPEWAKHWITRNEYHMSVISFPNMADQKSYLIDDLRTAIAEYDSPQLCIECGSADLHKGGEIKEPKMCFKCYAAMTGFTLIGDQLLEDDELAEIKAGHRIDKRLESDDCTDIRNHLSPSTRVVDL